MTHLSAQDESTAQYTQKLSSKAAVSEEARRYAWS